MDCATLYKTSRSAYEEEGKIKKAYYFFQRVIDKYPDSLDANNAAAYIKNVL
jgi:TolA-binding protein